MHTFFELQLKAGSIIGISVLLYVFILARDSFFQRNRVWLLATLIVPWIMPLLAMPLWLKNWLFVQESFKTILLPAKQSTQAVLPQLAKQSGWDWQVALIILFFVVSSIVMLRLIWGYRIIYCLKKKATTRFYKGYKVVLMNNTSVNPFSFFRTIYVPKFLERQIDGDMILEHERTHCSQLHSIDISLAEWLLVMQWWNPFAWWLRKLIAQNHEYCVDNAMVKQTAEPKQYQYALLNLLQCSKRLQLVNNFNKSLTKKRIVMMNKQHTNKLLGWSKGLLIVPMMLVLLLGFTNPERSNSAVLSEDIKSANNLRHFIAKNIKYPFEAVNAGAEGEVTVHFSVSEAGKVGKVKRGKADGAVRISEVVVVAYKGNEQTAASGVANKASYTALFEKEVKRVIEKMPTIPDEIMRGKVLELKVKFLLQGKEEPGIEDKGFTEGTPVYFIDGKEITKDVLDNINPESIAEVRVLKGQKAIDKYGERAKDGAVEITSKKANSSSTRISNDKGTAVQIKATNKASDSAPLVVVDGKPYQGDLNHLPSDQMASVRVEKRPEMLKAYGHEGKNGVVHINTKSGSDVSHSKLEQLDQAEGTVVVESMAGSEPKFMIKGRAGSKEPLYIVNGEEYKGDLDKVNAKNIESVSVIKNHAAIDMYGDKAKHGVIIIKMKSAI